MTATSAMEGAGESPARSTGQFGVIVFLASDIMLFAPFFAAYFLLRATNEPWPADEVELEVCEPRPRRSSSCRRRSRYDRRRSGAGTRRRAGMHRWWSGDDRARWDLPRQSDPRIHDAVVRPRRPSVRLDLLGPDDAPRLPRDGRAGAARPPLRSGVAQPIARRGEPVDQRHLAVLAPRRHRLGRRLRHDLGDPVSRTYRSVLASRWTAWRPWWRSALVGAVAYSLSEGRRVARRRRDSNSAHSSTRRTARAVTARRHGCRRAVGPTLLDEGEARPTSCCGPDGCHWPTRDAGDAAARSGSPRRRSWRSSPTSTPSVTAPTSPSSTRGGRSLQRWRAVPPELCGVPRRVRRPGRRSAAIGEAPNLVDGDPDRRSARRFSIGPGSMPVFGSFSPDDINDVAAYIEHLDEENTTGSSSFGGAGPVAEGLAAWLLGLVPLVALTRWIGRPKSGRDPELDPEAEIPSEMNARP